VARHAADQRSLLMETKVTATYLNRTLVLKAFDTLFNNCDCVVAERF
jgi:hypothetical protein